MTETERTFSRFIRQHWHRLNRLARRYASSREDADDLVQETLLRAWERFSPSEEHRYRGGWLFVIMRHVALSQAITIGNRAQKLFLDKAHSATMAIVTKRELGRDVTPQSFDVAAQNRMRYGKSETKGQIYAATKR